MMGDCANLCVTISAEDATFGAVVIFAVLFGLPWILGCWVIACEFTDMIFKSRYMTITNTDKEKSDD